MAFNKIFGSIGRLFGKQGDAVARAARRAGQAAKEALGRIGAKSPIKPLPPGERSRVFGSSIPTSQKPFEQKIETITPQKLFEVPPPQPRPTPAGDELAQFFLGLTVFVESEHVLWIQYDRDPQILYICYHSGVGNNAVYQYLEIDEDYAEKVFNGGSHVGTMVWNYLRVRGTVFGYQKPYSLAVGGHGSYHVDLGGYSPKYTQRPEWEQQHAEIPASGAIPQEWAEGDGPYSWTEPFMTKPQPVQQPPQAGTVPEGKRQQSQRGKGKNPWWYGQ